ncbi:aldolase/citrate lyase family protein [Candidatus Palauibacter sp.]|uniref:aldolase/citrate lyase family protein n=1 Tax=Candidatus Palauibacter sp. TaxID=3101350 RepID=UPI003C700953
MAARNTRVTPPLHTLCLLGGVAGGVLLFHGCGGEPGESDAGETPEAAGDVNTQLAGRLAAGDAIFGLFSGDHTAEAGAAMAATRPLDFVFYSLESGPFDIPALESYAAGMTEASGDMGTHPMLLRIPPIRDGHDEARDRAAQGLAAGVAGIVYPHVETAEEAALAVDALGDAAWPGNPDGHLISFLLIEDQIGLDNVREIVSTPGVSAVSPGPGDLRRVYDGDMEKVEEAIQIVLAACLEFDVPCGVTANADDVAMRIEQGFRVIIATQPEAVAAGMAAAGR